MTSRCYFGKMNSILGSVVPLAMFCVGSVRREQELVEKTVQVLNLNPEDINMFIVTTNVFFAALIFSWDMT